MKHYFDNNYFVTYQEKPTSALAIRCWDKKATA